MNPVTTRRRLLAASASFAATTILSAAFIRHARAADTQRFALGIASGHPRPDGMVLWTRLTGQPLPEKVDVLWEVATDESFKTVVASDIETADIDSAHTVHAEPRGLPPGRWYWYRFTALGQRSPAGRTRTAPAADADASLRFAIASCQRFDHNHYAAWRHLATQDLDLVMFLGDYIYEYPSPPIALRYHQGTMTRTLDDYRARYAQYKSDPALQAAHAAAPWLMVWDDHEIENDYANDTPQMPDPLWERRRAAATKAYWEHLPFPKAMRPRGHEMRLYGRHDWGTLARIHALDDRQYRDSQACPQPGRSGSNTVPLADCAALVDPKRSLLGLDQERWLEQGWDTQRPWNLLAQQTLMARFNWRDPAQGRVHWTDGWDGYAASRDRLLQGVAERKLPGVVVLGGDVHSHYVADLKADFDDARSPVIATEFCGTSIASNGMAQSRLDAVLPFNPHIHFGRSDRRGYMSFVLDAKRLDVTLHGVVDAKSPASDVDVMARFSVEAGAPGARRST